VQAIAKTQVEEAVRLSTLTLSAFACEHLANTEDDRHRLLDIGLKAGREFLESVQKLSSDERKKTDEGIAIMWRFVGGPTKDFILGQIFDKEGRIVEKVFDPDKEKMKRNKEELYSQMNCMIID
jgi:hypothetical protein